MFFYDWEQRKLSDLMTFSNGINAPKENYGTGTKMISVMDILNPLPMKYDNILNSVAVDKKIEDKNKVEKGDLIFVRSSEIVEEVGWAKAYKEDHYALYSGFAIRGKRISSYNAYFIELTLNYANRKEIKRRAGGSTRFNVSQEILNSLNVLTPSISEQNQIDLFFTKIDDTITLHQRKLDKLKQLKQGYLQQLFPKPGETVPKIRFTNFEAYWQERKLGELTQIKTGSGDLQDADSNGKFPFFVRSDNIEKSNRYIFDGEAVLIPGEGRLGDIYHYINGKFDYHQRVYKISNFSDSNMCGRFVLYELRRNFKRHALKFTVKATVDSLRLPILKNYKMKFPETQEQINIGNFLSELDIYIDFSQKRLTKLKICKKAFLQEMFL